jgi:hypothetical protein
VLTGHADHVQRRGNVWYIDIDRQYVGDYERLIAIVAHEFAHIVLNQAGVHLDTERRNEELTDTTAALAGFARIMLEASHRERTLYLVVVSVTTRSRIGYLEKPALRFIAAVRHKLVAGAVPILLLVLVLVRHILLGEVYRDPVGETDPSGPGPSNLEPVITPRPPAS